MLTLSTFCLSHKANEKHYKQVKTFLSHQIYQPHQFMKKALTLIIYHLGPDEHKINNVIPLVSLVS